MDTPERRVLSLEGDGVACIPVLGYDRYRKNWGEPPLHVHKGCIEVSLCLRGDLMAEADGRMYPFRPGTVLVCGTKAVHRIRAYPKGMSKYWFLFRMPLRGHSVLDLPPAEADALVGALTHLPDGTFGVTEDVKRLFNILFKLYDELPRGTTMRRLRIRSAVLALLLAVVDAATVPARDRAEVRLERLVRRMEDHPEESYPLDRVAEEMGFSPSNLLVRFKRLTGLPLHAFLLNRRIDRAKELMSDGMSVAAAAHRLGFSSGQHFSRHFKAITGLAPRDWKGGEQAALRHTLGVTPTSRLNVLDR